MEGSESEDDDGQLPHIDSHDRDDSSQRLVAYSNATVIHKGNPLNHQQNSVSFTSF